MSPRNLVRVGTVVLFVLSCSVAWAQTEKQMVPKSYKLSLGFGVMPGQNLFTSGQFNPNPSIALRVNLNEKWVIEPVFAFNVQKQKNVDAGGGFSMMGLAKYTLLSGNRTRFYGLGGFGFSFQKGLGNNATKELQFAFDVGFGGEYFFTEHWSVSLDVISPFIQFTWQKQGGADGVWAFGAQFQSTTIRPALHVYF